MFKKFTVANWMERIKFAHNKESDKNFETQGQKENESERNAEFKSKKWTRKEMRILRKIR